MEVVDIKKILAPNLLIYIYLHCVRSLSWCATTLATLVSKLEAFLVTKFINRLFVKSHIHTKLNLILSKNLDPLIDLRSFDFVFKGDFDTFSDQKTKTNFGCPLSAPSGTRWKLTPWRMKSKHLEIQLLWPQYIARNSRSWKTKL